MKRSLVTARVRKALVAWYARSGRELPWRGSGDPYAVWVSEIMLQQTQAATVAPYYERFLRRFPTVERLAGARLDAVLKLWEGLGYYSRARNLHRAAGMVVREMGGRMPDTAEGLRRLPGVGRYTAGAIASIAFGRDEAVVDGNVARVLCRLLRVRENPKSAAVQEKLWRLAEELIPPGRAGDFNEAMMDLGATVCVPIGPRCGDCPVERWCEARRHGEEDDLPVRATRRAIPHYDVGLAVVRRRGRILVAKRKPEGMLGGLWEFPGGKCRAGESPSDCAVREAREELGVEVEIVGPVATAEHAYSHFRVTLHAFECRLVSGTPRPLAADALRWLRLGELERYAFPAGSHKIIAALRAGEA